MKFDDFLKRSQLTKRKPRHIESEIQQSVVQWFRMKYPNYIIAAVPNGGFRNAREAAIMQREGVLAGFADLIIISKQNILFLELKTPIGVLSKRQKEFQQKVNNLGFQYVVCRSFDQAVMVIVSWIKKVTQV